MLTKIDTTPSNARAHRFAIVASQYNARYVNAMLRSARGVLIKGGAKKVHVIRVPGAFEIPVVAAALAKSERLRLSAIICLGVIIRGETTHAQHIGDAVSSSLAQIQITWQIPVIHEVLLLENKAQARVRCLGQEHNRGAEAAHTAIAMARTMQKLGQMARSQEPSEK